MNELSSDIYKFSSLEIGESIISGRLLKFNNPAFFNDPFDCDVDLLEFDFRDWSSDVDEDFKKVKSILEKDLGNRTESIIRQISEVDIIEMYKQSQLDKIARSAICCFTKDFKNTIMWSHYANNHKGVCLNFDLSVSNPFFDDLVGQFGQGSVNYNDYTTVNYFKSKQKALEKLFYTKSKDWEYEAEYRFFTLQEHGLYRFKTEFLKGVIFGIRVPLREIDRFKRVCEKQGFSHVYFKKLIKDKLNIRVEYV